SGTGGTFRLGLPGGAYMRPYVRFLATLTPAQRERALGTGLAFGDLNPGQQEALARTLMDRGKDAQSFAGLSFRVDYVPVGAYAWFPVAPTSQEADADNAKWPLVSGKTAEAVLVQARRFNPAAEA